nr:hypothetical protein [uncultured bacterium]
MIKTIKYISAVAIIIFIGGYIGRNHFPQIYASSSSALTIGGLETVSAIEILALSIFIFTIILVPFLEFKNKHKTKQFLMSLCSSLLLVIVLISYHAVVLYFITNVINAPYLPEEKKQEMVEFINDESNEIKLKERVKLALADNKFIISGELENGYEPEEIIRNIRKKRIELLRSKKEITRNIMYYAGSAILSLTLGLFMRTRRTA